MLAEPLRGYKTARVVMHADGSAGFVGLCGAAYPVTASAWCQRGPRHRGVGVPSVLCSCGFYAVADAGRLAAGVVLQVELYGRVVAHQHGYRGQHQRVLGVVFTSCAIGAARRPG